MDNMQDAISASDSVDHKTVRMGTGHGERISMGGICLVLAVYLLLVMAYCLLGAAMFMYVDGDTDRLYEAKAHAKCNQTKIDLVNNLLDGHGDEVVEDVERYIYKAADQLMHCLHQSDGVYYPMYHYENAIVYTMSTYTTLGYGNVNTKSDLGRGLMLLYAFFGVPLFLGFYVDASQAFRVVITSLVYRLGLQTPLDEEHIPKMKIHPKFSHHKRKIRRIAFWLTTLMFAVYLLIATFIVDALKQRWDLLTSLYFIMNSLALIGFGDVMPLTGIDLCLLMPIILLGTLYFGVIALIMQEEIQRVLLMIVGKCVGEEVVHDDKTKQISDDNATAELASTEIEL